MKDMHSHISRALLIGAASISADNTPVAVDRRGYESVEILLDIGIGGITFSPTNKIEFKLTHSDDGVSYTPVTINDVLGLESVGTGGIIKSLTAEHAAAAAYRCGYKGGKRYLQLLADFSGTHGAGTPISATALLGHGASNPQADQA